MPAPHPVLSKLIEHRLLAVIRAARPGTAVEAARAVQRGGLPLVEVTFTVPEAPRAMAELAEVPGLVMGAGTVLTAAQARTALDAGAVFIVAPNFSPAVAEVALAGGALYCPGAYTPTEIIAARAGGADLVKVHPVGVAGGPAYIRVIRDPLPDVPLLAAGGTTLENVVPFIEAGCLACGIGPAIADPALSAAGRFDEIEARARAFVRRMAHAGLSRPEPAPA